MRKSYISDPKSFFDLWRLLFQLRGSIIVKVWPQVLFGVCYSALIVSLHLYVPVMRMEFPTSIVSIVGPVLGFLLVFRTYTAYDRYWEGRKIWANMTYNIRVIVRCVWFGIKEPNGTSEELIEKRTAINLLIAFAYATKNYLRGEYSYEADNDIKDLIGYLSDFQSPPDSEYSVQDKEGGVVRVSVVKIGEGRSPSIINRSKETTSKEKIERSFMAHDTITPTNIPLELVNYFSSYMYRVMAKEMSDGSTNGAVWYSVSILVECLTAFERILRTPLPIAYSIHLHQLINLYLVTLPIQLVNDWGWYTLPVMGVACLCLLGILAIGWEIENPFGYDRNDLPLDEYCSVLKQEIQRTIRHQKRDPEEWLFSAQNRPFLPICTENAKELKLKSVEELKGIIFKENSTQSLNISTEAPSGLSNNAFVPDSDP